MKVAYKSDRGKKREQNEDTIFADSKNGIFLLADGMGGEHAGEIASRLAVVEAYSLLEKEIPNTDSEQEISILLTEAVFQAHQAILEQSENDAAKKGMGTTLLEMVIKNGKVYLCHVGDSRAYLIRDTISQLTRDQTHGNYLFDNHILEMEQIPPSKWHILTQAVGHAENLEPEMIDNDLKPGDYLLLCSDGLTGMLDDADIEGIVKKTKRNLKKTVNRLVDEANDRGGKDNISIILVKHE